VRLVPIGVKLKRGPAIKLRGASFLCNIGGDPVVAHWIAFHPRRRKVVQIRGARCLYGIGGGNSGVAGQVAITGSMWKAAAGISDQGCASMIVLAGTDRRCGSMRLRFCHARISEFAGMSRQGPRLAPFGSFPASLQADYRADFLVDEMIAPARHGCPLPCPKSKSPVDTTGLRAETGCVPVNPATTPDPIPANQSRFVQQWRCTMRLNPRTEQSRRLWPFGPDSRPSMPGDPAALHGPVAAHCMI